MTKTQSEAALEKAIESSKEKKSELENLEEEISYLESEIDRLEDQIEDLKRKVVQERKDANASLVEDHRQLIGEAESFEWQQLQIKKSKCISILDFANNQLKAFDKKKKPYDAKQYRKFQKMHRMAEDELKDCANEEYKLLIIHPLRLSAWCAMPGRDAQLIHYRGQ